ncbi:ADP-ribosylation factor-binding protein GGA3 isoform X1 [Plodia interpunctella]|uniref:ADP-ribosylation factor-binding protein GGA3 isoform X1 n=1 Tax=Plodia interpunctella TaxID=58824 RepID=UPI002367DEB7|nr:ADP-ribosylation factor-binding protein GGA3 isoform X1 [Plodia interpunctella]
MNVTLTSLEALILKATHETLPCPDAAALEAFCTIMRDSAEGPQWAAQALAARIHSQNPREAMLALTMLDRCMRRSDAGFHAEVGKFRFLNEMIKLVSPKYFADRTAPEVRTRVLQLLHAWSIEYPKESKFKVAYDMLKNQGVVKETPPPLPPEDSTPTPKMRAKNAIFEDEEKSKLLQKLLQSKKPEDLQHANRLIKTMVREEERRSEANSRRAQEVGAALDSAGLLRDMLVAAGSASADEEQLIHELHASCKRLRPVLQRLAAADADADNLSDILHANDVLDEVFEQYNAFVADKEEKVKSQPLLTPDPANESLLDFAGANLGKGDGDVVQDVKKTKNVIDELGDIFSNESSGSIAEPLKPVSLIPNEDVDLLGEKPKVEAWNELDSLGEQLMKQSLPESSKRVESFNGKIAKKIPMNALEKSPKKETQMLNNGTMFDLDFFTKKSEEKQSPAAPTPLSPTPDDVMVDITDGATCINNNVESPLDTILDLGLPLDDNRKCDNVESPVADKEMERKDSIKKSGDVKPLTDINVTLQSVQPSSVPPMTVFEEEGGLTVVLHFCKDKPRPDVNVIVVSTTNRNSSPIEDYKFQGVVPKGCKIRLLPASGSALPGRPPFQPPPALTQLLLLARPPGLAAVWLRFVLTYTCDDDTCSEIGEVNELPLDDI